MNSLNNLCVSYSSSEEFGIIMKYSEENNYTKIEKKRFLNSHKYNHVYFATGCISLEDYFNPNWNRVSFKNFEILILK